MAQQKLTLREINTLDQDAFSQALAGLFEGPPWIVTRAWSARPFTTQEQLYQTLCSILYEAPVAQQIALLQAHPDLAGRAAQTGTLSSASASEQRAAGLDDLTPDEIAMFQSLNQAYKNTFGFPFVLCARENKKAQMLAGLVTRVHHARQQEIEIALHEVTRICALRLHDLFDEVPLSPGDTPL